MADGSTDARYVFRIRVRIESTDPDVSLDPSTFETVLRKHAAPPGEGDWLFFRDNLWHGEVNDERHLRDLASETLGVAVESISFSELVCDEAYYEALTGAVASNLDLFRADDATEALGKYLGSSVRIEP